MVTATATVTLAPVQFPAGTQTSGIIRFWLIRASDGVQLAFIDKAIGETATFPTLAFPSMPDGEYRISAQRRTSAGLLLGSQILSDPFIIDSRVTLDIPVSISITIA